MLTVVCYNITDYISFAILFILFNVNGPQQRFLLSVELFFSDFFVLDQKSQKCILHLELAQTHICLQLKSVNNTLVAVMWYIFYPIHL